jgi:hypothetical protein
MEIGGYDIEIPVKGGVAPILKVCLPAIAQQWGRAVVQSGNGWLFGVGSLPHSGEEFFVFKDLEAFNSWVLLGADPSNRNLMVQLIVGADSLTLVVDDPDDPDMQTIISHIRAAAADLESDVR